MIVDEKEFNAKDVDYIEIVGGKTVISLTDGRRYTTDLVMFNVFFKIKQETGNVDYKTVGNRMIFKW